MNLLPKSREEFSKTEYWNAFFKKRGTQAFEWYGEYPELCGLLHKYIKVKDAVLIVGCGNSNLSADLYDAGYRNIVNIDISAVVIKQMEKLHSQPRPSMKFLQMDALSMSFEDGSFNVVLDKGTLDALMPDESCEVRDRIESMFKEIDRTLKVCGRWLCVSLLQDHVLNAILNFFPKNGWMVRICRCFEAEQKSADEAESCGLPVFVVVCTKMLKLPNAMSILEVLLSSNGKAERLASPSDLADVIRQVQQAAMLCSRLGTSNIASDGEACLDLLKPGNSTPRFTVFIRDRPCVRKVSRKFAAFVVPQGRETEWLFASPEGRDSLQRSIGVDRLAVITMHREHTYPSLEEVKTELTECIVQIAPAGHSGKIPFLSAGEDVGKRTICLKASSAISGDVVVEEVEGEKGEMYRRLIFLKNPNIIQSECKLKKVKAKKGNWRFIVDNSYLGCDHHVYMSVGVSIAQKPAVCSTKILVVGLGGGGLCSYLLTCFKNIHITAVDIDPLMEKIAKEYFGLSHEDRLKLHFEDGIAFLKASSENGVQYDALLFDIDSKDTSKGMSCPPEEFIQAEVLDAVLKCVGAKGIFILNLVCRAESLRKNVIAKLKNTFNTICTYKLIEDVNEVLFCSNRLYDQNESIFSEVQAAARALNEAVKERKIQTNDIVDVADLIKCLHIM